MDNLFLNVVDKGHSDKLGALKRNIAFAERLVRDLQQAFDVHVEHKRRNETTMEIVVYAPCQSGRYGWGFTFEATSDGVTFEDGRGVWMETMAKNLGGVKLSTRDYDETERTANNAALNKKAKKIGVEVKRHRDSACGDHFTIKTDLSETDKHLSAKLKLIIATMQSQSVVSRL